MIRTTNNLSQDLNHNTVNKTRTINVLSAKPTIYGFSGENGEFNRELNSKCCNQQKTLIIIYRRHKPKTKLSMIRITSIFSDI